MRNLLNRKLIIVVIILVIITSISLLLILNRKPVVALYNVEENHYKKLIELIQKDAEIVILDNNKSLKEQYLNVNPDLLVASYIYMDDFWTSNLKSLDIKLTGSMPSTIRNIGLVDGTLYQLPIQMDHIELSYNKNIYNEELIPSYSVLNNLLLENKNSSNFPMLLDTTHNEALIDIISLFTLSHVGSSRYKEISTLILNDSFSNLDETFSFVSETLNSWLTDGLLHPEYLNFTKNDVEAFLKNDLSFALITRLSKHREMPINILSDLETVPYPFVDKQLSNGILLPTDTISINAKSNLSRSLIKKLKKILTNDFYKELTFNSGLASVSSSSLALDKQASNVRLWGASANEILQPLPLTNDQAIQIIQ